MGNTTSKQQALQAIIDCDKLFLTPADVAPVLGSDPQTIRLCARHRPELLGFSFTFSGNRMKIPKRSFLRHIGIDIDKMATPEETQRDILVLEGKRVANEQLLSAIIQQIGELREEINGRLDALEQQIRALSSRT